MWTTSCKVIFLKKDLLHFNKSFTFFFMPFSEQHSKQTLLKALHWLDQQPDNWSEHIKDSQVAVQMYLKSQNKETKTSTNCTKEFSPFLKKELKEDSSSGQKKASSDTLCEKKEASPKTSLSKESHSSPPADWIDLLPKKKEEISLSKNKSLYLDEFSQKTLEQTKKDLNLPREEEALRLLIQLGRKALQKIFP